MKVSNRELRKEIIENACFRMDESIRMITKSLGLLSEEDLWKRPNGASNSVGNLLLHLRGNITQYAIAGLTGTDDQREREEEFNTRGGYGKTELLQMLCDTVAQAKQSIRQCPLEELLRLRQVQGFGLSGTGIILHVVEHLSYHTGQIAFWTKLLKDRPLGFYEGMNLNCKNKPDHA